VRKLCNMYHSQRLTSESKRILRMSSVENIWCQYFSAYSAQCEDVVL